jgi:hypothetical protein
MDISLAVSRGVISGVGGQSNVSGAGSPHDPAGPRLFRMAVRMECWVEFWAAGIEARCILAGNQEAGSAVSFLHRAA